MGQSDSSHTQASGGRSSRSGPRRRRRWHRAASRAEGSRASWLQFLFPPKQTHYEELAQLLDYLSVLCAGATAFLAVWLHDSDWKYLPAVVAVLAQILSSALKNFSLHSAQRRESASLQRFVEAQRDLTQTAAALLTGKNKDDKTFETTLLNNLVRCLDPERKFDLRATLYERLRTEDESESVDWRSDDTPPEELTTVVDEFRLLAHSTLYDRRRWPRTHFSTNCSPGKEFIPFFLEIGYYEVTDLSIGAAVDGRFESFEETRGVVSPDYGSFFNIAIVDAEHGPGSGGEGVSHMMTCDARVADFFTPEVKNIIRSFADMAQECFQSREEALRVERKHDSASAAAPLSLDAFDDQLLLGGE